MEKERSLNWLWALGLGVHLGLVVLIVILADIGRLPQFVFWPRYDLVGHFGLIGLLAFFLNGSLSARTFRIGKLRIYIASALVLVAALMEELSQGLMSNRTVSLWDSLADLAGILVFSWLADRLLRLRAAYSE